MTKTPQVITLTKRIHIVTFLGALLGCLGLLLWMTGPYLLTLYLGGTLAMLFYPVYQWLCIKKCKPYAAASIVTAILLLLVMVPLTGFSFLAIRQGVGIGHQLANLNEFSPKVIATIQNSRLAKSAIGNPEKINESITSAIKSIGKFTVATVLNIGKGVPEFLLDMALSLIAFYFFLLDGRQFMRWLLGLGAFDGGLQDQLVESFRSTTISAVLAGLAASASQAVVIALGFLILDVPGAFLAAGLTFVFAWIPILGTVPATLAALLYLYIQGSTVKFFIMISVGIAAGLTDNLVRPMVLKGRADMHPLVGLIAIIGGIQMFGILGVFIGPILAAMLLALLNIWSVAGNRFWANTAPTAGKNAVTSR